MKKIVLLFLVVIILSGCATKEEKIQKKIDKVAERVFTNKYPPIEYNFDDFIYEANECWYKNFLESILCLPGKQVRFEYAPKDGFEKLFVYTGNYYMGSEQSSAIVDVYFTKYVFNEFIFDELKGNRLDDMFRFLDSENIDYYIASDSVSGMQFQKTNDRKFFHYTLHGESLLMHLM